MATERAIPYTQFNFTVDLGSGIRAGFQEISNIGMEMTVVEYRNGNHPSNNVQKITGLNKSNDVTLKRGAIGVLDLYGWVGDIRDGSSNGVRNVTIGLRSEDITNQSPVLTWRLLNARIIKYVAGPLNAKSSEVAMEELTLSYERLEME